MASPTSEAERQIIEIFRYFDRDGDGAWKLSELTEAVRLTEGRDLTEEEYLQLCDAVGAHPSRGPTLEHVRQQYYADPASLVKDANLVAMLQELDKIQSPPLAPAAASTWPLMIQEYTPPDGDPREHMSSEKEKRLTASEREIGLSSDDGREASPASSAPPPDEPSDTHSEAPSSMCSMLGEDEVREFESLNPPSPPRARPPSPHHRSSEERDRMGEEKRGSDQMEKDREGKRESDRKERDRRGERKRESDRKERDRRREGKRESDKKERHRSHSRKRAKSRSRSRPRPVSPENGKEPLHPTPLRPDPTPDLLYPTPARQPPQPPAPVHRSPPQPPAPVHRSPPQPSHAPPPPRRGSFPASSLHPSPSTGHFSTQPPISTQQPGSRETTLTADRMQATCSSTASVPMQGRLSRETSHTPFHPAAGGHVVTPPAEAHFGMHFASYHPSHARGPAEPPEGVTVYTVEPNGPADRAGIKAGDIITGVGHVQVSGSQELLNAVVGVRPFEEVGFVVHQLCPDGGYTKACYLDVRPTPKGEARRPSPAAALPPQRAVSPPVNDRPDSPISLITAESYGKDGAPPPLRGADVPPPKPSCPTHCVVVGMSPPEPVWGGRPLPPPTSHPPPPRPPDIHPSPSLDGQTLRTAETNSSRTTPRVPQTPAPASPSKMKTHHHHRHHTEGACDIWVEPARRIGAAADAWGRVAGEVGEALRNLSTTPPKRHRGPLGPTPTVQINQKSPTAYEKPQPYSPPAPFPYLSPPRRRPSPVAQAWQPTPASPDCAEPDYFQPPDEDHHSHHSPVVGLQHTLPRYTPSFLRSEDSSPPMAPPPRPTPEVAVPPEPQAPPPPPPPPLPPPPPDRLPVESVVAPLLKELIWEKALQDRRKGRSGGSPFTPRLADATPLTPSAGRTGRTPSPDRFQQRLISFFEYYRPEKLPSVGPTLKAHSGHEAQVFEALVNKYGPEPRNVFLDELLDGWRQVTTSAGDLFYVHDSGAKQWVRPRKVSFDEGSARRKARAVNRLPEKSPPPDPVFIELPGRY